MRNFTTITEVYRGSPTSWADITISETALYRVYLKRNNTSSGVDLRLKSADTSQVFMFEGDALVSCYMVPIKAGTEFKLIVSNSNCALIIWKFG